MIECWFFDQEPILRKTAHQGLAAHFNALKLAPPHGPQFQLKLYAMKPYQCYCRECGNNFSQLVQKGVDNGIATKILSLAYENICDRFVLLAGDGDFYDSLNQVRNVLRKDIWVLGYKDSISGDLQQLASRVIWLDDWWAQIRSSSSSDGRESASQDENKRRKRRFPSPDRQVVRVYDSEDKRDRRNANADKRHRRMREKTFNYFNAERLNKEANDPPGYGVEVKADEDDSSDSDERLENPSLKKSEVMVLSDVSDNGMHDISDGHSHASPRRAEETKAVVVIDLATDSDQDE